MQAESATSIIRRLCIRRLWMKSEKTAREWETEWKQQIVCASLFEVWERAKWKQRRETRQGVASARSSSSAQNFLRYSSARIRERAFTASFISLSSLSISSMNVITKSTSFHLYIISVSSDVIRNDMSYLRDKETTTINLRVGESGRIERRNF